MEAASSVPVDAIRVLLVEAGASFLALPLTRVRRVVRALPVYPLPATATGLLGLAEFTGEPIAVFDLGCLVGAAPCGRRSSPATVVVWTGPEDARELIGLAVDAAVEIVELPADDRPFAASGVVTREVAVAGRTVRLLNVDALETSHGTTA